MNKKGFTLAELIGVIVVLSLICLITVPAISSVLNANKKSLCETQLNNILTAAKSYASENILSMPINEGETKTITIQELVDYGFIEGNIQNPVTKEEFDLETLAVKIEKIGKKLEFILIDSSGNEENEIETDDLCVADEE